MISNNFTFYQSAIGALRSGVGVLDGVPLQVAVDYIIIYDAFLAVKFKLFLTLTL